jgi:hypothetical protein
MTSPHPKITALLAAVGALVIAAKSLLDGDPATNPDWSSVALTVTLAWGLFTTRQNNVTSEQAGAKPAA